MSSFNNIQESAPKDLSPVERQIDGLADAQVLSHLSLDHLVQRLSVVLSDPEPSACGSAKSDSCKPPSALVGQLGVRWDVAVSINDRIRDILQRLTV